MIRNIIVIFFFFSPITRPWRRLVCVKVQPLPVAYWCAATCKLQPLFRMLLLLLLLLLLQR
jgi:hypothetical protein